MNLIDHKEHGNYLFSFNKVDESLVGKKRLTDFLNTLMQISEVVVCLCERPLLNESAKEYFEHKSALSQVQGIKLDDFELSFTYMKSHNSENVISLLSDCFYFFEHPAFIFLNCAADLGASMRFCEKEKSWKNITNNFNGCFVFKSIEDDVVWYRVSPNQQMRTPTN